MFLTLTLATIIWSMLEYLTQCGTISPINGILGSRLWRKCVSQKRIFKAERCTHQFAGEKENRKRFLVTPKVLISDYRSSAVFLLLIVRYQHAFISAGSGERVSSGEQGVEEWEYLYMIKHICVSINAANT